MSTGGLSVHTMDTEPQYCRAFLQIYFQLVHDVTPAKVTLQKKMLIVYTPLLEARLVTAVGRVQEVPQVVKFKCAAIGHPLMG